MILSGTYTEDGPDLEYVTRAMPYGGKYYSGVGHLLTIEHGDVLYMLGKGTWFALYQTPERRLETLKYLGGNPDDSLPEELKPKKDTKTFNEIYSYEVPGVDYSNMSEEDMKIDYSKGIKW